MSLIITVFTREGIVLAADSRLTLQRQEAKGAAQVIQLAVGQTDSVNKVFLAPGDVGIATYGAAEIQGVPISGYVDTVIRERLADGVAVDAVPQILLDYFRALPAPPATFFHVAGYKDEQGKRTQHVWTVDVAQNLARRMNQPDQQGVQWGGETDILVRLISPLFVSDGKGAHQALPTFDIPWQFFTLQDAIDFAGYGIRATIESLRFQARAKTVGGAIDVLVLRPSSSEWVARKVLKAPAGVGGDA